MKCILVTMNKYICIMKDADQMTLVHLTHEHVRETLIYNISLKLIKGNILISSQSHLS